MLPKASQASVIAAQLTAVFAFTAAIPAYAGSSDIAAVGAVESADCRTRTVRVLGITFAARSAGSIAAVCGAGSTSGLRYASVRGSVEPDGSIRLIRLESLSVGQYVPGATPVYLSGPISVLRLELGTIGISGALVASLPIDAAKGSVIEALGTQPVIGGVILPATIRVLASAESENAGSSVDSSIGSGASVNSSIGSGTSVNSSIGSGASVNSSIGSGTSVNSSIGSGTSVMSSIGSGTSANQ